MWEPGNDVRGKKKTTSNRRCQKITVRDDNIQSAHYELPAYIMIMPMCGTGVVLARLIKSTHVCGLPDDGLLGSALERMICDGK